MAEEERQEMNRDQRRHPDHYTSNQCIGATEEELGLIYVQSKIDECLAKGIPFDESLLSTDEFSKLLEETKCQ